MKKAIMFVLLYMAIFVDCNLYSASKILPLDSLWDQSSLYQKFTPRDSVGNETAIGCVNVAIGQIMRYKKFPNHGSGFSTSIYNNTTLEAITNRPYNWQNMPSVLNATSEDYQIDEVSRLLRDLAIANETEFGVSGSGANLNISALYKNFKYSKDIAYLEWTSSNATLFFDTIKSEIDADRPLFLVVPGKTTRRGLTYPGHALIITGYDTTNRSIYLNFGWGGSNNGYYKIGYSYAAFTNSGLSFNGPGIAFIIISNLVPRMIATKVVILKQPIQVQAPP